MAMATNIKVIHPTDFPAARPDGQIDLETSQHMLSELAAASAELEQFHVLIDIRNVTGRLSADELHELASALPSFGETFLSRTAVLCPGTGSTTRASSACWPRATASASCAPS
jgi:hypothetical protein